MIRGLLREDLVVELGRNERMVGIGRGEGGHSGGDSGGGDGGDEAGDGGKVLVVRTYEQRQEGQGQRQTA